MEALKSTVYFLCFATAVFCTFLLARSYLRTRSRLLLWAVLCFILLAMNNVMLFLDVVVFPTEINLLPFRNISVLAGLGILLYGFIWDAD
ncbi:DUF5985 family protein [Arenibaculum pallidiluteum]|uniref:DUF5985 family protein n=1 Tax=Arenibaculum pallidiluteum TaxID=2812559 RepID=UPI001A9719A4|nr:DUF5985 family protein [Arenibaculum pallidiluteum]